MKNFRRLTCALAALLLCCGVFAVRAAGRGRIALRSEEKSFTRGGAFTVSLVCERNPGVKDLRLTLSYDTRALAVQKIEVTDLLPGGKTEGEAGKEVLSFTGESESAKTGEIARVRFAVREDAPYGASQIEVRFSDRAGDVRDGAGNAVPFDVVALPFELVCPHDTVSREILRPATLSTEGSARVSCADCGASWEESILPELFSEDGAVRAVLAPRIFSEGSAPILSLEEITDGELYEAATAQVGDRLIRAFYVHFSTAWGDVLPIGEIRITLYGDEELPERVTLYTLEDGVLDEQDPERDGNDLSFPWRGELFLLTEALPEEAPPAGSEPEAPAESEVPATRSPAEEQARRDWIAIGIGAGVLVLTGLGIFLLTRRARKKY